MICKQIPACITSGVNENLLRRIEYPIEKNRVLRNQIDSHILPTDNERCVRAVAKPYRLRLTEGRTDFTIAVDKKLGGVAHDTS